MAGPEIIDWMLDAIPLEQKVMVLQPIESRLHPRQRQERQFQEQFPNADRQYEGPVAQLSDLVPTLPWKPPVQLLETLYVATCLVAGDAVEGKVAVTLSTAKALSRPLGEIVQELIQKYALAQSGPSIVQAALGRRTGYRCVASPVSRCAGELCFDMLVHGRVQSGDYFWPYAAFPIFVAKHSQCQHPHGRPAAPQPDTRSSGRGRCVACPQCHGNSFPGATWRQESTMLVLRASAHGNSWACTTCFCLRFLCDPSSCDVHAGFARTFPGPASVPVILF